MRTPLSFLFVVLVACAGAQAQTAAPSCPSVTVESKIRNPPWAKYVSRNVACWGAPVTFTAAVTGVGPKEKYTFYWTVSEGKIVDGQGTSSITVATEEADGGEVTATVELVGLRGLKPDCNKTAQGSVYLSECDPPCTTISLACPTVMDPGTPATVSANISGDYDTTLTKYNWSVSAGAISSGQGTPSITIDTTGLGGQNITVEVEVEGLAPECDRSESCTLQVLSVCGLPRLFDRFGDLGESEERARLDNYALALQSEPPATAYVIVSGSGSQADARTRLDRIKKYLAGARGIDPARIETVDGGRASELTVDLYILLPGAVRPQPAPNL